MYSYQTDSQSHGHLRMTVMPEKSHLDVRPDDSSLGDQSQAAEGLKMNHQTHFV